MLPRHNRLVSSVEFGRAVRSGRRASVGRIVVHWDGSPPGRTGPVKVGFIVSKSVGNAVTRNLVKRRLRELARAELAGLPAGLLVVRALPGASGASFAELGRDLRSCLDRVVPS